MRGGGGVDGVLWHGELVLALQGQFQVQGAVVAHPADAVDAGGDAERAEEQAPGEYGFACSLRAADARRNNWIRISRPLNSAAFRREEEAAVQHSLRAADLRAAAGRRVRSARNDGVSHEAGDLTMARDQQNERMPLTHPATGRPLPKREQPGYYPGFSTLKQKRYWDAATRRLVEERVSRQKPMRFFTPEEARTMEAVVDRMLPQDDRIDERRIPILPSIDDRLYENRLDGYRFEDMPPDQEAYRIGARAFEQMAQSLHGHAFHELSVREQEEILKSIHQAKPQAAQELWKRMNIERFWTLLLTDVVSVYYAHPWAWDEIGFGGPAYPRGYMRLE